MDKVGMSTLKEYFKDPKLISFWENLQQVYEKFETTHEVANYAIDKKGDYVVK